MVQLSLVVGRPLTKTLLTGPDLHQNLMKSIIRFYEHMGAVSSNIDARFEALRTFTANYSLPGAGGSYIRCGCLPKHTPFLAVKTVKTLVKAITTSF